jgi:hypothetical protein
MRSGRVGGSISQMISNAGSDDGTFLIHSCIRTDCPIARSSASA